MTDIDQPRPEERALARASRRTATSETVPATILRDAPPKGGAPQDEAHGAAAQAARSVPGLPRNAEGPVFREPWEAQAFAMVVALNRRGLFDWDEWAAALGEEIKAAQRAGDPDTGETYYRHWLAALEHMVAVKGIADRAMFKHYHDAWERAADRTPHGAPIALTARDFSAD